MSQASDGRRQVRESCPGFCFEKRIWGEMFEKAFFPSFEEGRLRPTNKMSRYLKEGAAGEVRQHIKPEWV
ncbi:MAG: hypothetical protein DMG11_23970 [Acidobacteria bacterium]|nr:MAG: hypothetical protein DMG11_23970 [Acidobacteriota bacterium]